MKLAGVDAKDNDLASIMVAGYVDGKPEILEMDDRGVSTFVLSFGFGVIGSGQAHFKISQLTAKALMGTNYKLSTGLFSTIFSIAVAAAPGCSAPLKGFKVIPSGVERLASPK